MDNKYLLYIDILGFRELVETNDRKVDLVYRVLNSLNVHRHDVFETIVFSDTVLVYNTHDPTTAADRDYIVWYSIEFAEDLHHRLTGQDIYFRALLTYGQFRHYELPNLDAFFGKALIDAYDKEKSIPSIGLFIDDECNEHNRYFRTTGYAEGISFVFLNRTIERLQSVTGGMLPLPDDFCAVDDNYVYLSHQVKFLSDVYRMMRSHPKPNVRAKFLSAWDIYHQRYPALLTALVEQEFDLSAISRTHDWRDQMSALSEHIREHSNLELGAGPGDGTDAARAADS